MFQVIGMSLAKNGESAHHWHGMSQKMNNLINKKLDLNLATLAFALAKQGHAARNDPAQFDLFSSISVCSFATLPGFCDIRILT